MQSPFMKRDNKSAKQTTECSPVWSEAERWVWLAQNFKPANAGDRGCVY